MCIPMSNWKKLDTKLLFWYVFSTKKNMGFVKIEALIGLKVGVFFPGDAVAAFREAGSKVRSHRGCGMV